MSYSDRVADAIELLHLCIFIPGGQPADSDGPQAHAHALAARSLGGLELRAFHSRVLSLVAGELGVETTEGKLAALLSERLRTVDALRKICAEHGSNEWPDNMYLPDVINKFLACYLGRTAPEKA